MQENVTNLSYEFRLPTGKAAIKQSKPLGRL
ncbi:hypothetical protein NSTC745_04111 [Nostoc sp. DSM 114161]